jgi:hypothetical protein
MIHGKQKCSLGIQKIYTALEFGSKKTLCYWIARND